MRTAPFQAEQAHLHIGQEVQVFWEQLLYPLAETRTHGVTTHKNWRLLSCTHSVSSAHSHPGTQLMELFALEPRQWECNGLNQVLALTSLLGSVVWHIFKLYWPNPESPLQRKGPCGGWEQEKALQCEPTRPWGLVCPVEQVWEDHSLGLHSFLTGDTSDKLQEVQLPLIPLRLCQLLYGHTSYILSDMLCAGDLRDMKTACEVRPTVGAGG